MFKDIFKNYIYPIAIFSGGMIGVGFLSLPYVTSKVGIWVMLDYFAILTTITVVINMIFCEISLKTPDFKRFPGFVGHYLGKKAEVFTHVLNVIGSLGVLLAYLLIGVEFLTTVLHPFFPASYLVYALIYFAVTSLIIYFDIKVIAKVEFWVLVLLFLSLILIFFEGFSRIKLGNILNLHPAYNLGTLFLPYGTLLFSLWSVGLIPEVEEMIAGNKNRLKKIVAYSTIAISIFYFLFILMILGITGSHTDQTALTGLRNFLGDSFVSLSILIGAMASLTAYITLGMLFKKTLMFDLKIKHWQAFVMTCFTPFILYLLGFKSFITTIDLMGGVLLSIDGILILIIYKKLKPKSFVIYPLSLVFLLGAIYEIVNFIK